MQSGGCLIVDFVCDSGAFSRMSLNNRQGEIADAVACFTGDVKSTDAPDLHVNVASLISEDTQFCSTGAHLSPAWVRRNIFSDDKYRGRHIMNGTPQTGAAK